VATIVDLKSGDPRLIIDTGMEIYGLGVTTNNVIVIGNEKIVTWDLPAGDCVLDARANVHDSVRTIVFDPPVPPRGQSDTASISPDFNYVAIVLDTHLEIYDISTGKRLVGTTSIILHRPWFTRDGREVWSSPTGEGWKIIKSGKSDVIGLEPLQSDARPSGGYLWESPHGRDVVGDCWILGSRGKRVMWLPYSWRVHESERIWDGQFLALLGGRLLEPVILEVYE
jgi:hypothetical protein